MPEKIADKILFRISEVLNHRWWFESIHISILYHIFGFNNFNEWWAIKKTMGDGAYKTILPLKRTKRWIPFFEVSKISVGDIHSIFEVGGSWGGTAETFFVNGYNGEYSIRDLPIVEKLQDYYLSTRNLKGKVSHKDIESPDLFYAGFSLSEMPLKERSKYESKIEKSKYVLIYYQSDYLGINNTRYFTELSSRIKNKKWYHNKGSPATNNLIGISS